MPRSCIIIHKASLLLEVSEESRGTRALIRALKDQGQDVLILHTSEEAESEKPALNKESQKLGAKYKTLEDYAPEKRLPLLPPNPVHRTSLDLLHAVARSGSETAIFVGSSEHAAACVEARRCGAALQDCSLWLIPGTPRPLAREKAGLLPSLGRSDLTADALELQALARAEAIFCNDSVSIDWIHTMLASARCQVLSGDTDIAASQMAAQVLAPRSGFSAEGSVARITVCIPFYEHAQHLSEALDSLAAQTCSAHEIIVVDDGSRSAQAAEALGKMMERFGSAGLRVLRQENAGPAAARNRAAAEATGDYIVFCDSDNRFRPQMLATLGRAIQRTKADAVSCSFAAFRADATTGSESTEYLYSPLGNCPALGLAENCLGDTNFIIRRELFLRLGGFPSGNRSASEDWQFLLGLVNAGHDLVAVPKVLFDYRLSDQSHSHRLTEWAGASAALSDTLPGMPKAWRQAWPHFVGLVRQPATRQAAAELETMKAHIKRQLKDHENHIQRIGANVTFLKTRGEALSKQITDLEATRMKEALQHRDQMAQEKDLVRNLQKELEARRDKIRRMEDSFSWKATAALRTLRRLTLDRWQARKAAQERNAQTIRQQSQGTTINTDGTEPLHFHFHIDSPRTWKPAETTVTVRGWCFCEQIPVFAALRARIGERIHEGIHSQPRPDILFAHSEWKQGGSSGFQIEVRILEDEKTMTLELCDPEGKWHGFHTQALGSDDPGVKGSYTHWIAQFDTPDAQTLEELGKHSLGWPVRPLISVLMPVYNTPEKWLRKAVNSVRAQTYTNWELCIANDASPAPHIRALLDELAAAEPRLRVVHLEQNGHICKATNAALELATGELCALFDHDDELAPHALQCLVSEFLLHPEVELVYSDEDKIDEQGARFNPHFKPDWNPELLTSQNYLCHLAGLRTATLRRLGGLRPGLEGSQDWDLFLRLSEQLKATQVRHIPRVLYHWRAIEGSTALRVSEKDYIGDSSQRALTEHFERLGVKATIERTVGGHWHVRWPLPAQPPLVSIIVPTRNGAALVKQCIHSLNTRTHYAPFEILLVDNHSDDPEALEYFEQLAAAKGVRVLRYEEPFNYSALNNFAAKQARGDVLCLLNNDIEALAPDWLGEMVAQALRPEIGAVGARLYYPDTKIQHAGVITGLGGVAGHAFKHFGRNEPGVHYRPHLTQNLSAITAACLVIRREVFEAVGGLNEAELSIAFNDVDFCLRVQAHGYRNVYAPAAELFHHESASRGAEDSPEKIQRFQSEILSIKRIWGETLLSDPAYNPNYSLDSEDFALAYPPRTRGLLD